MIQLEKLGDLSGQDCDLTREKLAIQREKMVI